MATVDIFLKDIVKILYHFSANMSVLMLYNMKKFSDYVRQVLNMKPRIPGSDTESEYFVLFH